MDPYDSLVDNSVSSDCNNLEKIVCQIKELSIDDSFNLSYLASLLLQKVKFSEYSAVAVYVEKVCFLLQNDDRFEFENILVNSCQIEFNNAINEYNQKRCLSERKDFLLNQLLINNVEEERKLRCITKRLLHFIGELFLLKICPLKGVCDCIDVLLIMQDDFSVDCLCTLLNTCGKHLEQYFHIKEKVYMDYYFDSISILVEYSEKFNISRETAREAHRLVALRISDWHPSVMIKHQQESPNSDAVTHEYVLQQYCQDILVNFAPGNQLSESIVAFEQFISGPQSINEATKGFINTALEKVELINFCGRFLAELHKKKLINLKNILYSFFIIANIFCITHVDCPRLWSDLAKILYSVFIHGELSCAEFATVLAENPVRLQVGMLISALNELLKNEITDQNQKCEHLKEKNNFPEKHQPVSTKPKGVNIVRIYEELKNIGILYEAVCDVLDQLTPAQLPTLLEKMSKLSINDAAGLRLVSSLIFQKATMEPDSCQLCVEICVMINQTTVFNAETNEKETFKKLFLRQCQNAFESERNYAELDSNLRNVSCTETESKKTFLQKCDENESRRKRCIGRLIGELFKVSCLTDRIVARWISQLISNLENETSVESLCEILTVAGKLLESKLKPSEFDSFFVQMKGIIDDKKIKLSSQIQLQSVIDLRENNWVHVVNSVKKEQDTNQYPSFPCHKKCYRKRNRKKTKILPVAGDF